MCDEETSVEELADRLDIALLGDNDISREVRLPEGSILQVTRLIRRHKE